MNAASLKLQATDGEDIQVMAAILQDAIVPVCDLLFRPAEKNFIMVVQRFCWGQADEVPVPTPCFERICTALDITGVAAAQYQGFDQADGDQMLDLLTVTLDGTVLEFIFAGNARLRLTLAAWQVKLADFGDPWPTLHQPCHAT